MSNGNYFKVDIEQQKNKYWIFKELQKNQAVVIPDVSKKEWWPSISRNIGVENKNIKIKGEKVLHGPTRDPYHDEGLIIRKPNIILEEIKKGKTIRFIPRINKI